MSGPIFPKWTNQTRPLVGATLVVLPIYLGFLIYYGGSPYTNDVGYQPIQPIPFSHAQHAGTLGLDCRYCHNTVEMGDRAAVPPTATCLNCHNESTNIWPREDGVTYASLAPLQAAAQTGQPIPWVRVNDLPDYSYFNHASHVAAGIGCASCHGRVDHMEVVYKAEPLSMAWCLDCHREPERHLRPRDQVTNMGYEQELRNAVAIFRQLGPEAGAQQVADPELRAFLVDMHNHGVPLTYENLQLRRGLELKRAHNIQDIKFMTDCSTCHR